MAANVTPMSDAWHGRIAANAMMTLQDPALIAAYAMLTAFAGPDGLARITAGIIGPKCGRDRTWATRHLNRLAEIGLIEKVRRGACTIYRLLDQVRRSPRTDRPAPAAATPVGQHEAAAEEPPETCEPVHRTCEPVHTIQTQIHQESGELTQRAREAGPESGSMAQDRVAKRPIPADWMPSEAVLVEATNSFPAADISWHVQRFVRRCAAGGYVYADPNQAWLDWVLADEPKRAARTARESRGGQNRVSAAETRFSAWAAAASRRSSAGDRR
jgi:hypothetical protein